MTEAETIPLLEQLCAAYREPLTDALLAAFTAAWRDQTLPHMTKAVARWIAHGRYMPRPAELIDAAGLDPARYRDGAYLTHRGRTH